VISQRHKKVNTRTETEQNRKNNGIRKSSQACRARVTEIEE
jgi:hypothetical protein